MHLFLQPHSLLLNPSKFSLFFSLSSLLRPVLLLIRLSVNKTGFFYCPFQPKPFRQPFFFFFFFMPLIGLSTCQLNCSLLVFLVSFIYTVLIKPHLPDMLSKVIATIVFTGGGDLSKGMKMLKIEINVFKCNYDISNNGTMTIILVV